MGGQDVWRSDAAAKPALVSPCLIPLHTGKGLGWKGDLTTWETMSAALLVILNREGNKREVKPGGWEGRRSRSPWCLRTPFTSTLLPPPMAPAGPIVGEAPKRGLGWADLHLPQRKGGACGGDRESGAAFPPERLEIPVI